MSNFTDLLVPLCFIISFALVALVLIGTSIKIVPDAKRLSVFRMGQFIGEKGPGIVVLIPFIDKAITSEPGKPIETL